MGEVTNNSVFLDFKDISKKLNKMLNAIKKSCYKCAYLWNCEYCIFSSDENPEKLSCNKYESKSKKQKYREMKSGNR